ncbi:MAG: aminotransferase class III-fold pyridoxal phosphate-dependent enzyme [Xanthomonadales bacterium]|nr:aminotransferase class III-fold pyridoxal phosphate-dependent enzyme [Gammaproteobacteria bacterium]NNE06368.1 aminotransferase class III-fold pyridoxal phosphate-dependent enzyme [Xanthomonadales bacterium]NNL95780.1 aminotransferase class III-fold pyridoxal phosphate-dependent enzyme [Xanthomonadales bacterium]
MTIIDQLNELRKFDGEVRTSGLSDATIIEFAERDPRLGEAVQAAVDAFEEVKSDFESLLSMDEMDQVAAVQDGFINFYPDDAVNPYVSLAAAGPWLVTLKGAVLYDCGGYGMIGFGHAPAQILDAMNQPHVMANIMTPHLSQKKLIDALKREIGHSTGRQPFDKFVCLNSGSESVTMAARISDINAKIQTDPGGEHANQPIRMLGLKNAFHGRTDRPARFSDSTRKNYCKHLASFRDQDNLITVEPNNTEQLQQVFDYANNNQIFIESFFIEPVMGEGNPGKAITPEFYALARKLTREHGALLLVDSIQAGLRAHGVLSICDYPGFEQLDAPDMETYSKALNGGQYPLSVLALNPEASELYRKGVYGNTMTANPRAMDVAVAVLNMLTPELRNNIVERGKELVKKFSELADQLDGHITAVQGTGLLVSVELDSRRFKSYGSGSSEEFMRFHGVNVIHGGENSLRYTPHFLMSSAEVDLVVEATRQALLNGPVKATASVAA